MTFKISIASDHAGFHLKSYLKDWLKSNHYGIFENGCSSNAIVDYPDFIGQVVSDIKSCDADYGVLICGSGIGMSIGSNRFHGIRAALCYNVEIARLSREHNDANVLCLGAAFINPNLALEILKVFCKTEFTGGRHKARIEGLDRLGN